MARRDEFALPKGWTKTIRSSVLHAVSLASAALTSNAKEGIPLNRATLELLQGVSEKLGVKLETHR